MKSILIVSLLILTLYCSSTSVYDPYIIQTPARYSDNRVLYVSNLDGSEIELKKEFPEEFVKEYTKKKVNDLKKLKSVESSLLDADQKEQIKSGSPLSIILKSVGIPKDAGCKDNWYSPSRYIPTVCDKSFDIAVLLDITTRSDQKFDTMVVWFQRSVRPGQTLNFSNILVYYESAWDSRYPPTFRVRLVNVADIKNKEVGEVLGPISSSIGSIAAVIQDPLVSPLIQTSMTAAKLILTSNENTTILDYTVQFYSDDFIKKSGDSLTGLRCGSFVVLGNPITFRYKTNDFLKSFWDMRFYYKSFSGEIFYQLDKESFPLTADVPFMTINISPAESIIPKTVIERSLRLNKMLTSYNSGSRITDIEDLGKGLAKTIDVYTSIEKARKFGRNKEVKEALEFLDKNEYSIEDTNKVIDWLNKKCEFYENKKKPASYFKKYLRNLEPLDEFKCPPL